MEDFFKKVTNFGFGVVAVSREKIEEKVREWTESEHLNASESKRLVERLVAQGEQERAELQRMVQDQVKRSLVKFGIFREDKEENQVDVLQGEIKGLRQRIAELEEKLEISHETELKADAVLDNGSEARAKDGEHTQPNTGEEFSTE